MRVGLSVPVMDAPATLVDLAVAAEHNGWDGVFFWHHVVGTPDFAVPIADAWVVLGAVAARTERIRLGTTVTGLPRHQPHEVARQAVTVDHLSRGRMVLGVGLGEPPTEYTALGRSADRATLARMLDEGLDVLSGLWSGAPLTHHGTYYSLTDVQLLPAPAQRPRIPVWVSAMQRNARTLGRAARWDGVLLGAMRPDGAMGTLPPDDVAEVAARPDAPADIVVAAPVDTDPADYLGSGATWVLLTGWLDELHGLAAAQAPNQT